jgi:hypothetical protein
MISTLLEHGATVDKIHDAYPRLSTAQIESVDKGIKAEKKRVEAFSKVNEDILKLQEDAANAIESLDQDTLANRIKHLDTKREQETAAAIKSIADAMAVGFTLQEVEAKRAEAIFSIDKKYTALGTAEQRKAADEKNKIVMAGTMVYLSILKQGEDQAFNLTATNREKSLRAIAENERKKLEEIRENTLEGSELRKIAEDELRKGSKESVAALSIDNAALTSNSKKQLQETADIAKNTYLAMKAHPENFSEATIKAFKETADAAQDTASDIQHNWKEAFANIGAGVTNILIDSFTKGGGIVNAAKGVAVLAGAEFGKAIGKMTDLGKFAGPLGAAVGSLAGPLVEGLVYLFTDKVKKAVQAANKEIQVIETSLIKTYGPMDELKARAELLGVAFVDFGQQGKVGLEMMKQMAKQLEERTLAVRDAAEKVTAGFAAMVPALTAGFSDIAKRVTDAGIASKAATAEVKKLTDQGITSGVEFEKANALATKTAGELTQALTAQHDQGLRSGQSLKDVGLIGVAAFAAAYASTGSYTEALKKVGPSLATLGEAYKDLGLDVEDVALKHLVIASTVQKNNPALMAAIDGQAGAMQGLAQLGLLNVDTFSAMQRTGMEMYSKLQSEVQKTGGTTRDALLPMQGYLQQAAEQARLLGIPLDANTQELIDQSVALGIWKDKGKSANDLLIDGMSTLVNKLNDLISGLTGIPSPTFTVTRNNVTNETTTHQDIYYPDVDERGERSSGAHGGLVTKNGIQFLAYGGMVSGYGTDTVPAMLTPGEAVLTTGAVRSLGTTSISRLNSGGSLSNDDVIDELRLLRKQQATSDRQLPLLVALSVRDAMQLNR